MVSFVFEIPAFQGKNTKLRLPTTSLLVVTYCCLCFIVVSCFRHKPADACLV